MFMILGLCLFGNLIGMIIFAFLITSTTLLSSDAMIATTEHLIASKVDRLPLDIFIRAIFCNFFINLAILIVYAGNVKSDFGKVIILVVPVLIFAYLGLDHVVANAALFLLG